LLSTALRGIVSDPAALAAGLRADAATSPSFGFEALICERTLFGEMSWHVARPASSLYPQFDDPGRWSLACVELPGDVLAWVAKDSLEGTVLLVRDPMGEVPLCFLADANGIAVAFTPEPLALRFPQRVNIDFGRVADTLIDHLQWIDLQSTFYRQIRKVPPGCWVRIDANGVREGRYWFPNARSRMPLNLRDADLEAEMLARLRHAVTSRVQQRPNATGSMLSGGLDSSSVVGLAAECLEASAAGPLFAFAVLQGNVANCPETAAITAMEGHPGVALQALDVESSGPEMPGLAQSLFAGDEPWDAYIGLLRWTYRRAQGLGLSVMLDGIDADSLFLAEGQVRDQLRRGKILAAWRNVAGGERFWKTAQSPWPEFLRQSRMAAGAALGPLRHRLGIVRRQALVRDPLQALLAEYPVDANFARKIDLIDRHARYEANTPRGDELDVRSPAHGAERYFRAASGSGVLPSHPFMDPELVQFCLALPGDQKIRDGWPKSILRRAMRGLLPDLIRWRRGKEHLGFNVTQRLTAVAATQLHLELSQRREMLDGIVAAATLDRLTAHPAVNADDHSWQLYLLVLAEWLHRRRHLL